MEYIKSLATNLYNTGQLLIATFPYIPTAKFTDKELGDQTGKVYIVTGSTTGIGYVVVKYLYEKNAKVYVVGRTEAKINKAIEEIKKEYPESKGELGSIVIDFADLSTIKPGIAGFLSKETKLNGIVHNAGVMFPPPGSVSTQGYEMQVAVNTIGPQLLQHFLDDIIIKTAETEPLGETRIVWVSSAAHLISPPKGYKAEWLEKNAKVGSSEILYGMSKALNIYQGQLWAKHHPGSKVLSFAVHPGVLKSELSRYSASTRFIYIFTGYDTKYGAYTELYGLASPDITPENVVPYYVCWGSPGTPRADVLQGLEEDGEKVWALLEDKVKEYL